MDTCDMCGDEIGIGDPYRVDDAGLYCEPCAQDYELAMHIEFGSIASPYSDEQFDVFDAYEKDDPKVLSFLK